MDEQQLQWVQVGDEWLGFPADMPDAEITAAITQAENTKPTGAERALSKTTGVEADTRGVVDRTLDAVSDLGPVPGALVGAARRTIGGVTGLANMVLPESLEFDFRSEPMTRDEEVGNKAMTVAEMAAAARAVPGIVNAVRRPVSRALQKVGGAVSEDFAGTTVGGFGKIANRVGKRIDPGTPSPVDPNPLMADDSVRQIVGEEMKLPAPQLRPTPTPPPTPRASVNANGTAGPATPTSARPSGPMPSEPTPFMVQGPASPPPMRPQRTGTGATTSMPSGPTPLVANVPPKPVASHTSAPPKPAQAPGVVATDTRASSTSKAARGEQGRRSPTDDAVFAKAIRDGLSDEAAVAEMLKQRAARAAEKYNAAKEAAAKRKQGS